MRTMGRGPTVLCILAAASLAACGVGTWHIPDVPPVVKPEPEEDLFEGLELDEEPEKTEEEAKPDEPAAPPPAEGDEPKP